VVSSGVAPRWLISLLPMPLLLALGAWSSARVAERAGADGARVLSAVAVLARAATPPAEPSAEDGAIPTDLGTISEPLLAPVPASGKQRSKHAVASGPPVLFVSKEAVLGIAATGARPHGVPVPANGARPTGLKLAGVSALGLGVRDGDVLTRAVGQPALSTSAVINAVLVARAHHARVLEGELWRGTQRIILRVEQPYLGERRAEGEGADEPTEAAQTDGDTRPRVIVTLIPRSARL
jgi:hypothetical protein